MVEGQIVVTIVASTSALTGAAPRSETTWAPVLDEVFTLQRLADARLRDDSMEPGVVRQRDRGKLNCRQRIALLLDEGSFREVGSVTGFSSSDEQGRIEAFTPSNHVGGWGRVDGRTAVEDEARNFNGAFPRSEPVLASRVLRRYWSGLEGAVKNRVDDVLGCGISADTWRWQVSSSQMGRTGGPAGEGLSAFGEQIGKGSVRLGPSGRQARRRPAVDVVEDLTDELWIGHICDEP